MLLKSVTFEDCIRLSISIGGDSNSITCIAGGIAQAYYRDIPNWIITETRTRLPQEFLGILDRFEERTLKTSDCGVSDSLIVWVSRPCVGTDCMIMPASGLMIVPVFSFMIVPASDLMIVPAPGFMIVPTFTPSTRLDL